MKKNLYLLLILVLFLIVGCSSNGDELSSEVNDDFVTEEESMADADSGVVEWDEEVDTSNQSKEGNKQRKVIYTGEIAIEVDNYKLASSLITEKVNEVDGYIVESNFEEYNDALTGELVVRIPKEHFQSFLAFIAESDGKVIYQSTNGNDVTEEYVDLDSRLKAKRVVEERLLGFMEAANSTDNLLKISNELAQIQEDIETITGRMNYLQNQVELSTFTIHIEEKKVEISSFQDKKTLNTWGQTKQAFIESINFILLSLSKLFIIVIGLSPIIIPTMIVIGAILWWRKRRKVKE